MTGNDDGGFSPVPGDPWHPGWSPDAEPDDETVAGADALELDERPKKSRKRRRFGRRSRDEGSIEATEPVDDAEPLVSAADPQRATTEDAEVEPADGHPEDPFDAVLRAEGRSVRRRSGEADDAPVPDWTADREIPDELTLPVAPPSWVGDATATDPAVEATGFEPVAVPIEPVDQPDLFAPSEDESLEEAAAEPGIALDEETEAAGEIVGEFGVAGPEAFDALADTTDEDLGDWDAFMEGAATPAEPEASEPSAHGFGSPAEPLADGDAFDEWVESEPKQKRRWFRRRPKEPAPVVDVDWGDDAALDTAPIVVPEGVDPTPPAEDPEAAVAEALAALGAAEADIEPLAAAVDDTVVWSPDADAAWDDEVVGDLGPAFDPVEDLEAATDEIPDTADSGETPISLDSATGPVVDPGWDDAEAYSDPARDDLAGADAGGIEEPQEMAESEQPFVLGEVPDGDDEALVEEPGDWEGDPSQVPSSWFADVDEDTVVPPNVDETPETEWPADEGRWEGRAAWDAEESSEVFDVEAEPVPVEPEAQLPPEPAGPVVPEGYEEWERAVANAATDAGEETAEYHVQHIPAPSQALPDGFEPFPGSEADVAYGGGSAHPEDRRMPSDDTFEGAPAASMGDVEGDGPAFDEQIYAGGGTIEHRGLAEAIAAGEDDDTEWQAMSAAMPGVETGVLGFEDVADLADGDEYVAPVRSNLGVRVLTGIVLLGMLVGSLFVGGWAFALFVGAIVLLGLGELYSTLGRQGYLPLTLFGLVGAAGTLGATWFHGPVAIPAGIMLTGVAVFFFYAFAPTRRDALTNAGVTLLGLAWAVGAIAFAIPIARAAEFEVLVFAVVVSTAAMDIGAYSVGRRFGRRPMAPVLSPNKTVEGLFGGAILALAAAGAFGFFELGPFDLEAGLALGAIVVVMAPLGDLAESMIKRSMGVKDMGSTLPGHGGVLDRIDALVFVIPGAWVLFEVLGYLG